MGDQENGWNWMKYPGYFWKAFDSKKKGYVEGYVAPGYEPVRRMLEQNFKDGLEASSQLCVYVGDEIVVDLWGAQDRNEKFGPDSLVPVLNSSKSLMAIVIALLVDNDMLDYEENISGIWPEFPKTGEENFKVSDVLKNELGIPFLNMSIQEKDTLPANIKNNSVGNAIEDQEYKTVTGTIWNDTTGWIANEVVRRIDPKGRTIGDILRYHLSEPLGARAFIGLKEEELEETASLQYVQLSSVLMSHLLPTRKKTYSLGLTALFQSVLQAGTQIVRGERQLPPIKDLPIYRPDHWTEFFNSKAGRMGEIPNINANCSARGLAVIGACMANKGVFKGIKVLSDFGWSALHGQVTERKLFGLIPAILTQGGVNVFKDYDSFKGRNGFVGWVGFGGSIFQWHPEERISFAYVPTMVDWSDVGNNSAALLQETVMKCHVESRGKNN